MLGRGLRWVVSSVAVLTFAASARAEGPREPAIWYRASDSCPPGAEFLAKLADGRAKARLAGAGDHIDFVVTLLSSAGQTVGRLERQTNGGVVAIRELHDATCDRVADALALSLALALEPTLTLTEPSAQPADEAPPAAAAVAPAPVPVVAPTAPIEAPRAAAATAVPAARPAPISPASRWFLGADGGLLSGLTVLPMPMGQLFADVDHALPAVSADVSFRFAVLGGLGSTSTNIGSIGRWVLAGRAEACPVRWGSARFGVRPCVAFEVGASGASLDIEGQHSDARGWLAPGAELRASFALLPVRLEAGAGAVLPLSRNELFAGSVSLYRDAIIGFRGSLGVSFGVL